MAARALLAAALLSALAACGGEEKARTEVLLLAPAGIADGVGGFERATGCRVDLRVYDEDENVAAIARRRDVDVVAGPVPPGRTPDVTEDLVRVRLERGLEVTIPKRLARAFDRPARPAGSRAYAWTIRDEGENETCARRWLDYVRSQ